MAQPSSNILQKRLKKVLINPTHVRETGSELGRGAYGVVVELEAFGMRCAGKRLHDVFFSGGKADETNEKILSDFAHEISQMRKLRHPNIVQFLGIVCSDTSVTLVMEFIPTTLGQCLEDKKYNAPNPGIPSFIKNSLLLDIALGLLYLHGQTPPIIHRDLSSNNVLITSTWQAKISDLGVAKALNLGSAPAMLNPLASIDSEDQQMHMSIVPGTDIFMPPECRKPCQDGKAMYGPKLDCFSFGNLIILIVLQVGWLESTLLSDVPDDAKSQGQGEVTRRSYYLNQMEDRNPLKDVAIQCLQDDPNLRPSADDIVRRVKEVTCNDPLPFANTLDLYRAFIYAKGEESEYQKKIAVLSHQMKESQERIAELKRKHEEEITELKHEYEEKITELKHDNASCSDAKTDHECEPTTTLELSHPETPRAGWTQKQSRATPQRQPRVTPRRRDTHPVPRPRPRNPRPLSTTDATLAPAPNGTVSPTGEARGAVAPTSNPGVPVPVPRARNKLCAALSVDSFVYIPEH